MCIVQRFFTNIISGMSDLSYWDRLRAITPTQKRGSLIFANTKVASNGKYWEPLSEIYVDIFMFANAKVALNGKSWVPFRKH